MKTLMLSRILIGCAAASLIFLAGCQSAGNIPPEDGGFSRAKSEEPALRYLLTFNPDDPSANRLAIDVLKRGEIPYELDAGVLNTVLIDSKHFRDAQSALLAEKRLVLFSEDGCLSAAMAPANVAKPVSSISEWNTILLH